MMSLTKQTIDQLRLMPLWRIGNTELTDGVYRIGGKMPILCGITKGIRYAWLIKLYAYNPKSIIGLRTAERI